MIEKIVLDYLSSELSSIVVMERPEEPPAKYHIIEKTGSGSVDHIDSATIAIRSYAPSLLEAAQLNEAVKTAMESITELANVGKVKLNSDYNFTDASTKEYRYQAIYNITYHS